MPRVKPEILRWARESAGFALDEAARRIALNAARGLGPAERLAALEAGEAEPTRALLLRMAKQYRRPLLTFYLPAPPQKGDRGQDFRTLPADHSRPQEALLDVLIRDVVARQSLVRAALVDEDEATPLSFVGSARSSDGLDSLVGRLSTALAFRLDDFRAQRDPEAAFALLRGQVEQLGVFVLLLGNLGSHHTALSVRTFRGFTVADPVAPFLIVNDQDSRAAWSFTLLHELTHLWLGQTGVSGGTPGRDVEQLCNDVASELLLKDAELAEFAAVSSASTGEMERRVSEFAFARNVSRSMVSYRLFRRSLIGQRQWEELNASFRRQWDESRERQREAARDQEGGPNYYVVRRHRLGNKLLQTAARLVATGALSTSKASQILGVKPNNVQPLIASVSTARGAA